MELHSWTNWQKHALSPFVQIKDHVLLPFADQLEEVDATFKQLLTDDKIREIVNAVPDDWLNWTEGQETPQDLRDVYIQFLEERIKHSEIFVNEAQNARKEADRIYPFFQPIQQLYSLSNDRVSAYDSPDFLANGHYQ